MGTGVGLACDKCGFEMALSEGVGMCGFDSDEDAVRAYCGSAEARKFRALLLGKSGELSDLGYKIYECEKCGVWQQKSAVSVVFEDGSSYHRQHRCVSCRSKVSLQIDTDDRSSHLNSDGLYQSKCRKCGFVGFRAVWESLWD